MKSSRTMADNEQIRFGRYKILDELGRGAMGVVYKALDPQINREVAIKTISVSGLNTEEQLEYRARFYREAEAAGRISHPGIVTVFDVGAEEETRAPYIVMELVSGGSLEDLLLRGDRKLEFDPALKLAVELAEALDCAHGHGVVHRDLKPANILLTEEGRGKIADFGIAKLNLANLTLAGSAIGTPSYMSPEQLNGEAVDGRSDLFSLGAVLYTVLTGYKPFQGNSVFTVSFKVVNRDPVPATVLNSQLPAGLDHIIGRAMSKDPAKRYQSGEEMAKEIRALVGGTAVADEKIPTYVKRRPLGGKPIEPVPPAHIARKTLKNSNVGTSILVGAVIVTGLCLYEARTIVFPLKAAKLVDAQEHSAKSDTGKKASRAMDSLRALTVSPQSSHSLSAETVASDSPAVDASSNSQAATLATSPPESQHFAWINAAHFFRR
jgi:serine/threonine protein kinase